MDTETLILQSLADDLFAIKWLLGGVLFTLIAAAVATVLTGLHLARLMRNAGEQHELDEFRDEAEELLAADRLDELVEFARDKLRTHPRHTFAHWYLAVAHFHQGKLHHSKRGFERVRDLEPGWGPDYVEPYLDELRHRIREATPKLVRD